MKERYDWVPWFEELANKIADGGEQYLIERAKQIVWKENNSKSQLLNYGDENIDPLSFFSILAFNNRTDKSRRRVFPSVEKIFGLHSKLDPRKSLWIPTPRIGLNLLFHGDGDSNPKLLWQLFRQVVQGIDAVEPDDFENALKIRNVATKKLTQVLFLINPKEFIQIDEFTKKFVSINRIPTRISWKEYTKRTDLLKTKFPGCQFFEIQDVTYLLSRNWLRVQTNRFFQVSTNVDNTDKDYWEEFSSNNWVFTSRPENLNQSPVHMPKRGEVILVRFGSNEGRGIAVVYQNDYEIGWSKNRKLHVLWINKTHAELSVNKRLVGFSHADEQTVDAFRQSKNYAETLNLIDHLSGRKDPKDESESLEDIKGPLNQIIYGPPGTGKTWSTTVRALAIIDGETQLKEHDLKNRTPDHSKFSNLRFEPKDGSGQVAMVTFHQNFAYEDFVEGIRPTLDDGTESLTYELRPGIFKKLVEAALNRPADRFVLVIDEINRGNIAKIFGELITLIEDSRRLDQKDETRVTLPYSGESFGVPDNLYIIGTMNTADRSIQLLDTALRRRFTFIEMMPDAEHEHISSDVDGIDCQKMLKAMNERIAVLLDREHQIGHTYLFKVSSMEKLSEVFRNKIFPLLQEYFFEDWSKIRTVLNHNNFVSRTKIENVFAESDYLEETKFVYERLPDSRPEWNDSNEYRKIYSSQSADGQE